MPIPTLGAEGGGGVYSGQTVAVDLQTGKQIWSSPSTTMPPPSFGLIFDTNNPNQHGTFQPILVSKVGSSWQCFDAYTGHALFNVTNVPSGKSILGPNGEIITYVIANAGNSTNPDWRLGQWNSTKLWSLENGITFIPTLTGIIPTASGITVDGSISTGTSSRYDWNVSIPSLNTLKTAPTIDAAFYNNMLICNNGTLPSALASFSNPSTTPYTLFAINLNSASTIGSVQWRNTITPTANLTTTFAGADPTANNGQGVFITQNKETLNFQGYSMATGQQLYGPTPAIDSFAYYGAPATFANDGNVYIASSMGGTIYCYNLTTGQQTWKYTANAGYENALGEYPVGIYAVGNGVIYAKYTEHTYKAPINKGAQTFALNTTDGSLIWTLSNANTGGAVAADGFNVFFNGYDNQLYTVGRGPSQTTVSAPNLAATLGQGIFISGTVTDISVGITQTEQAARFPNGVPVASDSSMSDWMSYVYQQQPKPTNFTGVEVTINVVDANGNYRTIGTATTDTKGFYSLAWTPDISGKYSVIATFTGTNGYWGSSAETGFTVDEPAATATPQQVQAPSMADLYFIPGIIGVIVAIIVVGAVLALLLLRKRP